MAFVCDFVLVLVLSRTTVLVLDLKNDSMTSTSTISLSTSTVEGEKIRAMTRGICPSYQDSRHSSRNTSNYPFPSTTCSEVPSSQTPRLNVVLYQPEIPQNTGNIGRTCVALNAKLWIVRPTGFRLDDKQLQRAGLDYWQHLNWESVDSWTHLIPMLPIERTWFFTKFATKSYTDAAFQLGDWLVFGSESSGLPDSVREQYASQCVSLPMIGPVRSLNLSVAVGVGLFEAHRQLS